MDRINVTKSFLPPYEEYAAYLRRIWTTDQLTNQGPLLQEFQTGIQNYLGVENFQFVSNGTIALQLALHSLGITEGEIITTPFSYVATASAILWERCKPVFVDIDAETLCMDPKKIEAAITPRTKAIMPVHVFGHACDIEAINLIAQKHSLPVIYDGAHAFGATHKGKSLLDYGDITMCSFHSTKVFHTIEGGGLVIADKNVSKKIELIKRFGHNGDDHKMLGINAKASEFQAAMGLAILPYAENIIKSRKSITELYDGLLGSALRRPHRTPSGYNYAYYPVILESEEQLHTVVKALNAKNIFPRRYFYPSLNNIDYIKSAQSCPVSEDVAVRILCLPLYQGLEKKSINLIAKTLLGAVKVK